MNADEMLAMCRKRGFTMWAMVNGVWKQVIGITDDQVLIADWKLPTEVLVKTCTIPMAEVEEFDVTP